MFEITLLILLAALILDWFFGEPDFIWSRIPHPVVVFGKAVSWADGRYNIASDSKGAKIRKGSWATFILLLGALLSGLLLDFVIELTWPLGWVFELFFVFALVAQRSLYDHVEAVATGLRNEGVEGGRHAVGMIVGRDPKFLGQSGVCRASIESLAENFSDGVVAPVFWYAVFGLPGIFVYKMINTLDSMIAYKNEKYIWFGRSAAQIDDLANWLPARLSALLISCAAGALWGMKCFSVSLSTAFRDAGLHRSPNAGWPEAAMAGGVGVSLGGTRIYEHEKVSQPYLNASGERELEPRHITKALKVFERACFILWFLCSVLLFL